MIIELPARTSVAETIDLAWPGKKLFPAGTLEGFGEFLRSSANLCSCGEQSGETEWEPEVTANSCFEPKLCFKRVISWITTERITDIRFKRNWSSIRTFVVVRYSLSNP